MGSVSTQSALILRGKFSTESRKYPVWEYLEDLVEWFDKREHDDAGIQEFYAKDFSFLTPHADRMESISGYGEDHAFTLGAAKIYTDPLENHKHVNTIIIALESSGHWDIYAHMTMYANVEGTPAAGEEKVKDDEGKEWELEIPLFYHLNVGKDPDAPHAGLRMKHVTMVQDHGMVNDLLDARGVGHKRTVNQA